MTGRRAHLLSVLAIVTGLSLGVSTTASAAPPRDAEAAELAKKAIYSDYLETRFPDAEKKLKQALALCEPAAACSDNVRAQLHHDLGIVYVGGMSRRDEGKAEFVEALKKDPTVELDADLVSPEIETAFAEAKRGGGGGAAPAKAPPAPSGPPASAGSGDLVHTPPAEQATLTPLPLYVELPAGLGAARVQAGYKPFGATTWKTLELENIGTGWGAEIPCLGVGTATGTLEYYFQVFDAEKNLVSWSGTRNAPLKVAIRSSIEGEAPHLPGQAAPLRCPDPGDCPPEFPGCHGPKPDGPAPCDPASLECGEAPRPKAWKNWVTLGVQQDFLFMASSTATCAGGNEYVCFGSGGDYYSGIPYEKSGDEMRGGASSATTRILAGYDRVVGGNFTIGARLGFAFGGGPKAPGGRGFLPFHGEARVAYWFGHAPFERSGARPYLVIGGGTAQVDSKVGVVAYDTAQDYVDGKRMKLDAWKKSGTGFIGGGAGLMFAITPRTGPLAELKVVELLGASSPSLNLQLGYAVGF